MLSFKIRDKSNFVIIIPAILAFFISLVPTLKYGLPLSWDIFYHIHLTEWYQQNGLVLWDSISYAPFGRPIFYPPLFHLILMTLSSIFKMDILTIARYLQPILAFSIVFCFSFLSLKLYNARVGFLVGFLLITTLPFHRFMLPIPESVALIFFALSLFAFHESINNNNRLMAIFSGVLTGLAFLTHPSTAICLLIVILGYSLIVKLKRNDNALYFLLIFLLTGFLTASIWWLPLILNHGYLFSFPTIILPLDKYDELFGLLNLIFAPIGAYILIKRRSNQDILVLVWLVSLLSFSQIYLIGLNVLNDRILNFAVIPLVLMASVGVNYFWHKNKTVFYASTILIIFIAAITGFWSVEKSSPYPDDLQMDIATWFSENGDLQSVVLATDTTIEPIIIAISRQPVAGGGYGAAKIKEIDRQKYMNFNYTIDDLKRDRLGYLVFNSDQLNPPWGVLVYQNKEYKIFRMDRI